MSEKKTMKYYRILFNFIFLILILTIINFGCREKAEKVKSDKEEIKQKQETEKLIEKKKKVDANLIFEQATSAWNALRLQEAVDLFAEAEKSDQTIELKVKLRLNALAEKLVTTCQTEIEKDGPALYKTYARNPGKDPLYISKNCLDFIISEDRIKETTQTKAEEVRDFWKRVNYARENYLKAHALINAYKRVEGVNILKELSRNYRDSNWGLAAEEDLIKLGEYR